MEEVGGRRLKSKPVSVARGEGACVHLHVHYRSRRVATAVKLGRKSGVVLA
jgi:hypothetical protein